MEITSQRQQQQLNHCNMEMWVYMLVFGLLPVLKAKSVFFSCTPMFLNKSARQFTHLCTDVGAQTTDTVRLQLQSSLQVFRVYHQAAHGHIHEFGSTYGGLLQPRHHHSNETFEPND